MNTYTIYLGAAPIATVSGCEYAYIAYRKTVELAEILCQSACLVWNETGEIIADTEDDC